MNLVKAIKILHAGKYRLMNVDQCNGKYAFKPDYFYYDYRNAQFKLNEHRAIRFVLQKLGFI